MDRLMGVGSQCLDGFSADLVRAVVDYAQPLSLGSIAEHARRLAHSREVKITRLQQQLSEAEFRVADLERRIDEQRAESRPDRWLQLVTYMRAASDAPVLVVRDDVDCLKEHDVTTSFCPDADLHPFVALATGTLAVSFRTVGGHLDTRWDLAGPPEAQMDADDDDGQEWDGGWLTPERLLAASRVPADISDCRDPVFAGGTRDVVLDVWALEWNPAFWAGTGGLACPGTIWRL